MSYEYADRKRENSAQKREAVPQTSLDALRTGAAAPTREQMGHRVDLPDAMREKMESAFGADLSAVKLYESQTVADAGANAMARGADIAFAPGMLDFTSYAGQALLGHEISHVVSQARGEVTGGGFLSDSALEARADREGAMAAAGQTIAMPASPMSAVTAAPAAGPMQAKKDKKEPGALDPKKAGKVNMDRDVFRYWNDTKRQRFYREGTEELGDPLFEHFNSTDYDGGIDQNFSDPASGITLSGLNAKRTSLLMRGSLGKGKSNQEITDLYEKLMAPKKRGADPTQASADFGAGIDELKEMYYQQLKGMESTYGTLLTQMHPEDVARQIGPEFFDQMGVLQDAYQIQNAPGHFDPANDEKDAEFARLADYYNKMYMGLQAYTTGAQTGDYRFTPTVMQSIGYDGLDESAIGGPHMSDKEFAKYKKGLNRRARKERWTEGRLFGKFRS